MFKYRWALLAVPIVPAVIYGVPRVRASITSSPGAMRKFGASSTAEEVTDGVNLAGKVAIVTGASSGIGAETARVMALRGATVVMAVRNTAAGEKVRADIVKDVVGKGEGGEVAARLRVLPLDLQSLSSVRSFVGSFSDLHLPLHILINNAGVMMCPFLLTSDGVELQFGTNHLGHFHLTNLLMPALKQTASEAGAEGRVVIVSSMAHLTSYATEGIRLDRLNSPEGYTPMLAYGQSKLANVLHARELARRLKDDGVNVTANALHPGVIRTELLRHIVAPGSFMETVAAGAYHVLFQWFMKSIPQGAATSCYVAANPAAAGVSGRYFSDCNEAEEKANATSRDMELARKLWEKSEEMVKEIESKP